MSAVNAEFMRSARCRRGLRVAMWALLFLVPIPLPKEMPDFVAWGLFLVAFYMLSRLHPAIPRLYTVAAIGLALWVARAFLPYTRVSYNLGLKSTLFVATWVAVFIVVWRLFGVVAQMAEAAGNDSVQASARGRRWVWLIPLALLAVSPAGSDIPKVWQLVSQFAFMLVTACVLTLLMGVLASAARMCAHLAQTEREPADRQAGDVAP